MTSRFVFDLLDAELKRVQTELLERVAVKYGLDRESLVKEFVETTLRVIPDAHAKVEVIRKKPRSRICGKENVDPKCMARVWNRGRGGQCSRDAKPGTCFCYQHEHEESRKHGIITADPPANVFKPTRRAKALYI